MPLAGGCSHPGPRPSPSSQLRPSAPTCPFVSWLFPCCFSAHSADGAAPGTLHNQRAPVVSALLCPRRALWNWHSLGVAMAGLRAGGASFCLNSWAPVSTTTGCLGAVAAARPLSSDAQELVWVCGQRAPC